MCENRSSRKDSAPHPGHSLRLRHVDEGVVSWLEKLLCRNAYPRSCNPKGGPVSRPARLDAAGPLHCTDLRKGFRLMGADQVKLQQMSLVLAMLDPSGNGN
jgi:hypothetical protein